MHFKFPGTTFQGFEGKHERGTPTCFLILQKLFYRKECLIFFLQIFELISDEPFSGNIGKHLSFLTELALKIECARKFCEDYVEIFGKEVDL